MASSASLLASVPNGHGILFNRLILLALSIAALTVYATTYSIYHNRIESTGAFAPSRDSLLIVNGVSLLPSTISIVWSLIHLSILGRRLLQAHRQNSRHLTTADEGRAAWDLRRAVIHPVWSLIADGHCFALFVVAAVLTGVKVTEWKNGKVDYGSEGMRQVNLGACPTFDPATGKLDYWCEQAWNEVVNLSNSGTSILGTLAGIHLGRVLNACYDLYLLRRHHYVEETHSKRCADDSTADCHSYQTQEVELERYQRSDEALKGPVSDAS